ncbi:helix-turn-helix transcriptional regulator [Clostridioides difficile]|uniref:helix-turn-helix domain-containing protein n=1 Tax=Clostridioides difficile TaxID=1496 RepID=UPI001430A56A|nr:helix-turn-helix transcriptional regulator [Clostridioides difficile]EGT5483053.1 XRE family transcriptional regulator [Clostridioides difficile]EJA6559017.1 helix-turn-helix transcriptional regulator [Clostridioides difficile]MBY2483007.1 helix-turn-helix domain-containing protein [Clostridioides difficile]MCB4302976.1 helix-turn-helix domain-containing protein [Clostridioides difficile]MCM0744873.1 helix-turn-helix domain-containing protein [Clostridioides difficile]
MEEKEKIKRLIELRKTLGHTQEEVAKSIKISRSNYGNIETGKVNPTERVISDICDIYNVNKEWLETGKGEMFIEFSENEKVLKIATDIINEDDKFMKNILFTFSKLSDEQKEFLINLMKNMTQ